MQSSCRSRRHYRKKRSNSFAKRTRTNTRKRRRLLRKLVHLAKQMAKASKKANGKMPIVTKILPMILLKAHSLTPTRRLSTERKS